MREVVRIGLRSVGNVFGVVFRYGYRLAGCPEIFGAGLHRFSGVCG